MTRRPFDRKIPLIILLLLVGSALILMGAYQTENEATAATSTPGPSITVPTLFTAYGFFPGNGSTDVAVDTNVTVRFSRDMNPATINSSTFTLKQGGTSLVAATVTYDSVTDTAVLNPSGNLSPGTVYVATVTDDVESTTGSTPLNVPVSWSFTTATAPDWVMRTPDNGDTDVSVTQVIAISFNKDMDETTFTGDSFYLKVFGTTTKVPATVGYNATSRLATLSPNANLDPDETYEVTLSSAVKSEGALSVNGAPLVWLFSTAAEAPEATTLTPANTASDVPLDQVVSAVFDQDMDASTITSDTFYLKMFGSTTKVPATVAYDAPTRTATLTPDAPLEAATIYDATLSAAVKGQNGEPLAFAPVVWEFMTSAGPPVLIVFSPVNGATGVPVDQVVAATFDQDMDASTINSGTFYLQKTGGAPLATTVSYDAVTRTATLDPTADLEAGATYQVTLSAGIQSLGGLPLAGAPHIWFFTTTGGSSTFTDVIPGVTPYATAIATLASRGIILGFPDNTFRPTDLVTRQQFAKMIVLTMGFTVTGTEVCPYTDVAAQVGTDPYYPSKYVAVCASNNITKGKTATTFDPYSNITHQQLITMLARAAALPDPPAAYTPPFTAGQFSIDEHYLNARKAASAGLLNGLLGVGPSYDFLAGSTRGECAQLLFNLIAMLAL